MAVSRPFQFQRFTVMQAKAAMKVGFDGVLLGAWAELAGERVLDIGTGTGLVALMAAQRTVGSQRSATIDAIDIDGNAITDAEHNFEASPWSDRLRCHHASLRVWTEESTRSYDRLLCNPPFFTSGMAGSGSRATARHDGQLTLRELAECSSRLLAVDGRLSLIVPVGRLDEVQSLAVEFALHLRRTTLVRSLPEKPHHRVLVEMSAAVGSCQSDELTIETTRHNYSSQFHQLTRDFYIEDYQP